MSNRILIATIAALIAALVGIGCGSSDKSSTTTGAKSSAAAKATPTDTGEAETDTGEKDTGKGDEEEEAKSSCREPATSKPTGLPASFPKPEQLTITGVRKEGPTTEVDGYFSAEF